MKPNNNLEVHMGLLKRHKSELKELPMAKAGMILVTK
jgi:hypothetical protein